MTLDFVDALKVARIAVAVARAADAESAPDDDEIAAMLAVVDPGPMFDCLDVVARFTPTSASKAPPETRARLSVGLFRVTSHCPHPGQRPRVALLDDRRTCCLPCTAAWSAPEAPAACAWCWEAAGESPPAAVIVSALVAVGRACGACRKGLRP